MTLTAAIKTLLNGLLNWSEQTERWWRDCTQRSYLMLLIFGGLDHAKFVLGIYTGAEGERFEDAEGLPETSTSTSAEAAEERGLYSYRLADVASRALFGVVAHDASEAELPVLLNTIGVAIALPGQGVGLPAPSSYPSGYFLGHSVTVVPIGNGQVVVMNPLDGMKFEGSLANVSDVLAWHRRLPNDIRYVRRDEFSTEETMFTPTGTPIGIARVGSDSNIRAICAGRNLVIPLGTDVPVYAEANINGFAIDGTTTSAAYLVGKTDTGLVYLLKRNAATYTPIGGDVTHTVTLTDNGKTVATVTI